MQLKPNHLLQGGKYRIIQPLGQGGFGITYLAEQTNLGREVCIKEFFMKEYGERTTTSDSADGETTVLVNVNAVTSAASEIMGRYREKFVKEARIISQMSHPGIVHIHDVFEENGTAYYVMDYIEGENLNDLVRREGPLSEERALGYIRQVADALSYIHGRSIMHLDVKPSNIIIRKSDDKAILIDFGAAKQYDSDGTQTSTTPIGLSAGYAPIELMRVGGVKFFSPETDVYSLGATLYYLVTGKNPPDASERMEMIMEGKYYNLPDAISSNTANVIEQSMQARKKRIQNVISFLDLLNSNDEKKRIETEAESRQNEVAEKAKSEPAKRANHKAKTNKLSEKRLDSANVKDPLKKRWLLIVSVLFLLIGFIFLFLSISTPSYDWSARDGYYRWDTSFCDYGVWGVVSLAISVSFSIICYFKKIVRFYSILILIISILLGTICIIDSIQESNAMLERYRLPKDRKLYYGVFDSFVATFTDMENNYVPNI